MAKINLDGLGKVKTVEQLASVLRNVLTDLEDQINSRVEVHSVEAENGKVKDAVQGDVVFSSYSNGDIGIKIQGRSEVRISP